MRERQARHILRALIQGVDPDSGEELAAGSVLQRAEVLRAMLAGLTALEESAARSARRAQLPANVGQPWTLEEDLALAAEARADEPLKSVAARHGRSVRAIEARLEKLGLLPAAQRLPGQSRFGVHSEHHDPRPRRERAQPRDRRDRGAVGEVDVEH